jgi:hypothetical protein
MYILEANPERVGAFGTQGIAKLLGIGSFEIVAFHGGLM